MQEVTAGGPSIAHLLIVGLELEIAQYVSTLFLFHCLISLRIKLQHDVRVAGDSITEELGIVNRRQRLSSRIRSFIEEAVTHMHHEINDRSLPSAAMPEQQVLPFPSLMSTLNAQHDGLKEKELALRLAQMRDCLHQIRLLLSTAAWDYKKLRRAVGNQQNTRSWNQIKTHRAAVDHWRNVYNYNRSLIIERYGLAPLGEQLGALLPEHLTVNTVVSDPNAPGQSGTQLSWIWLDHNPTSESSTGSELATDRLTE